MKKVEAASCASSLETRIQPNSGFLHSARSEYRDDPPETEYGRDDISYDAQNGHLFELRPDFRHGQQRGSDDDRGQDDAEG